MSDAEPADGHAARPLWREPGLWLGIVVTVGAIAFTLRGISLREVGSALAHADPLWLLGVAVPANVLSLWVRGLRWKHLASHLARITAPSAYRATAIGYLVNNLLPLRIGEIVRAWVLARESGGGTTALFGTVLLERVIDAVVLLAIAAWVVGRRVDLGFLIALLAVPLAGIALLKWRPRLLLGAAHAVGHALLPAGPAARADELLQELADGLAGLTGVRRIAAVAGWSFVLWGVAVPLTFLGPIRALPIGLAGPAEEFFASYLSMLYVAIAVAVPSAPGFFGVFHAACREALGPLGVSPDLALAMGTLAHVVFWLTYVVCGLFALRAVGTGLRDVLVWARSGRSR